MRVALFGHPLLFFVLCLSICPRPVPGQFPVSSRPALGQLPARRQPFLVELATLPHRPWAPKPSEPLISGFSSTKTPFLCAFCPSEPPFSGISSTKSGFLCSEDWESGIGNPKIGIGNTESGLRANHRAHL